jgi:hypothetical protein
MPHTEQCNMGRPPGAVRDNGIDRDIGGMRERHGKEMK